MAYKTKQQYLPPTTSLNTEVRVTDDLVSFFKFTYGEDNWCRAMEEVLKMHAAVSRLEKWERDNV